LGVDVIDDQIEDAEIDITMKEVEENIEGTGKIEMYKLQKTVSEIEDNIHEAEEDHQKTNTNNQKKKR